ncbi:nucleoside 2-deoxyribosyltransferase [Patescibacteria group bacterium]
MKDLYITSTLHSDWNKEFNPKICAALEKRGIICYLPQRDTNQEDTDINMFQKDIQAIQNVKKLLCIAENESVNWGGEVGYAYGIKKDIIALKSRNHEIPLILKGMVKNVIEVDDLDAIEDYIQELVDKVKE